MELSDDLLGGKQEAEPIEKKKTIITHAEGVDIKQPSRPNNGRLHETEIIAYCGRYNVLIANTLNDAMDARLEENGKQKVLSFREADCCFRQQLKLDNEWLWESLFEFPVSCIFEEMPPVKHGVYELRGRYNAGLKYIATLPQDQRQPSIMRLKAISAGLTQLKYPMYKEEKQNGFEQEFLKPEWMTWRAFKHRNNPPVCYVDEMPNPLDMVLQTA